MVGLFGALARAVTERRHELAIRAAVGASSGRLVSLVLRGALAVTGSRPGDGVAGGGREGRSARAVDRHAWYRWPRPFTDAC